MININDIEIKKKTNQIILFQSNTFLPSIMLKGNKLNVARNPFIKAAVNKIDCHSLDRDDQDRINIDIKILNFQNNSSKKIIIISIGFAILLGSL